MEPEAVLGCGSDVACPGGKRPLPEEGASLEAMLGAAVAVGDVDAGVWPETRQSRTLLI